MVDVLQRIESSDEAMIELLRQHGALGINELATAMQVTATAVRQRLNRLTGDGMIERDTIKPPRGRPSHKYSLTEKARRRVSNNFADLTIALWQEIREIKDPEVRAGLLQRLAKRMAGSYSAEVTGDSSVERMNSIVELFRSRNIPFQAGFSTELQKRDNKNENTSAQLPVLTALACPYPVLAEHDRGICALENMVLTELVGERVKLTDCRLDGASCCRFQTIG